MRSKRNPNIPQKFEDSVHSINNTKTNSKKTVSKNNDSNVENQIVECNEYRENGESNMDENAEKEECCMANMECDTNVDSMIVEDNCNEDAEVECIPTEMEENRVEVVVFDDIMVAEGSKRWDLTLCGFFVGYRMSVNELRYNLRRMWSRYGFKDIVDCNNGIFFMKFHHEEVPLLVKLCNVPLEAWTVKGISALASRVGKPLVMDSMTASMCKQGIGMCRKCVKVEDDWKPPMCSEYEVAGHTYNSCYKNESNSTTSTENKKESVNVQKGNSEVQKPKETNDSFVEKRELLVNKGRKDTAEVECNEEDEDVLEDLNGVAMSMEGNEVREAYLLKMYTKAMKDEESILFRKAKVKWLSVGDKNNAYFHKTIKSRQQKNIIDDVCDENGNRFKRAEVADQFVRHFQKFLGESRRVEQINDMESLFQCKLSNDEAEYIIREVNDEEIRKVMFQIDDNKAPGPDGKILKEINSTIIALVPKIQTPLKVSDFRLIACLNVLCKCISKIITQRVKGCLDKLMGPKRVAVKVDIQKAYDIVNWQFLEDILNGFGFHSKMVQWVMRCVSTTSFSICVNGQSGGYFKGGRGLRQRDPMTSYLFTLVMEILTLIIKRKVEQNNNFQYHFGCKKLKITNVYFADDLFMFCYADKSSRTIIFGCLNEEEKQEILDIMPFKVEKLPIRYLGRLMLVASVLESIYVYWASVFLLPVGVIKDINKLLKNILWNQNDGTKGRAKSSHVIAFAKRYNGNSINSIIRRVCIAASVCLIWQERNNMIFRDEERNSDDLYKMLNEIVRMRLMSLKVKDTLAVRRAQEIWNVDLCIMKNADG
ncbi:RNA-directed DNA polymerase, eukaryota, reverse transcriptase zinc-binding domain protein [Tanacetum coccineum]|uniref:RNA-directed DNA polymerase, eukaryota, reverse transcriptase zinc-binding domain protein n=1 Tax=Tanacetum coccineum TaxID=301880 RepID=A0ABQ5IP75_9ASTR